MNKLQILVLTGFLVSLCSFKCAPPAPELCGPGTHDRNLGVQVSPEMLEHSIGDTIWLSANIDAVFKVDGLRNAININGRLCELSIFVVELVGMRSSSGRIIKGYYDFEKINEEGFLFQDTFLVSEEVLNYKSTINFDCSDDLCRFKIGFVAQKEGEYCIGLDYGYTLRDDDDRCAANIIFENEFDVGDFNRQVAYDAHLGLLELPREAGPSASLNLKESEKAYLFRVR